MTLRITGFLYIVQHPILNARKQEVSKTVLTFTKKPCVVRVHGLYILSFLKVKNYLLYFGKAEKFNFFGITCICISVED
jgi:hypothetical protein